MSLKKVINYLRERKPQRTWSKLGGQNSSGGGRKLILMADVSFTNSNGQHLTWHQKQVFEGPDQLYKGGRKLEMFQSREPARQEGSHISVPFPWGCLSPTPAEASALLVTEDQSLKEKRMLETRGNGGATEKKLNLIKWPTYIDCFSGYV